MHDAFDILCIILNDIKFIYMKTCFLDKKSQEIYGDKNNYPLKEAERVVAMNPKSISNDADEVFMFLLSITDKVIEFVETPYLNSEAILYYVAEAKETPAQEMPPIILDMLLDVYYLSSSAVSRIRSYNTKKAYRSGIKMGVPAGTRLVTEKSKRMKPLILERSKHFYGFMNNAQLAKDLGISVNTLKKYIRELKETDIVEK